MASPQWKNFQPSAQDPAMPQRSSSFTKTLNDDCPRNSNSSSPGGATPRETGIVEKLLHSYGFIQCCERQARLFFHYSQFSGNIDHLRLGDAVEFEMTYDRRTGKPIASSVCKITSEVGEVMCEERVSGFVTTEIKDNTEGRVAYENRGECFFLPYSVGDVEGGVELAAPDKVTFCIATDKNTGSLRACKIRLEKPLPVRHRGVICALKETFGFIERADVVKEIFFHASECKAFKSLKLGDDVEFSIQSRMNKEVAVNVSMLPHGTVVFEDIGTELLVGQITVSIDKNKKSYEDALSGKIKCQLDDDVVYYPFGLRDQKFEYTLKGGDWVQFNLASDRRDNLQRATNIEIMIDNESNFSREKREQGFITSIKETFGFITYSEHDGRIYFRLSELLDPEVQLKVHDEVEFTAIQDPIITTRHIAIRVKPLPPGTIECDPPSDECKYVGVIGRACSRWNSESPQQKGSKKSSPEDEEEEEEERHSYGYIICSRDLIKEKISYTIADCDSKAVPRFGDKVEFGVAKNTGDNRWHAINVKVISKVRNGFRFSQRGFIAALKDTFGFIETEEHDKEVFFHYSVFDGNASNLEVGQEVEYGVTHKGNKLSAECVRKISPGSIPKEDVQPEILNGVVLHPLRCFNPDQELYPGKIRLASAENMEENLPEYEFGITSLDDKHEFLQKGDVVQFQIGVTKKGKERAVNIKAIRTRIQANVDTVKGNFGFLSYEAEEGKKLFFHMSEVKGDGLLQSGDIVEFIVVNHQRTGKYSACSIVKVGESQPMQRPERLNRLRTISCEGGGPRIILIRQPRGPDGSNGFKDIREEKENGVTDIMQQLHLNPDLIPETSCYDNETHEPNAIACS